MNSTIPTASSGMLIPKKNKKPMLMVVNTDEEDQTQEKLISNVEVLSSATRFSEKLNVPQRSFIENHNDTMIQNLISYMEGANSGLDLSFFWYIFDNKGLQRKNI
jgi:hypothetical protein